MERRVNPVALSVRICAIVLCGAAASGQPSDPIVGTWKLNLAKSQYATPAPKSMTITIAPAPTGWTVAVDGVGPDGQPQKWHYTSRFDGAESPVSGNPAIDAAVFRSTATGGIVEYRKAGKVIVTTASAISDDGKTMTVTVKSVDARGAEVTTVAVYDRQ